MTAPTSPAPRPVAVPGTTDDPVPEAEVRVYARPAEGLPSVTDHPAALVTAARAIAQGDGITSVKIEGDAEAVLAARADRVAEWNRHLSA